MSPASGAPCLSRGVGAVSDTYEKTYGCGVWRIGFGRCVVRSWIRLDGMAGGACLCPCAIRIRKCWRECGAGYEQDRDTNLRCHCYAPWNRHSSLCALSTESLKMT